MNLEALSRAAMDQEMASLLKKTDNDNSSGSLRESDGSSSGREGWLSVRIIGPGLLVCLADTDAGCLIVAAQSGAMWGYSLLLLQIVLIPILFFAQELTVRLGVFTKQGHTACIRQHFGPFWSWSACLLLVIECVGAMISEMSGIASIAELWGLNRTMATLCSAAMITAVVILCSYRQIEVIGVLFGLFELTFVVSMFLYHPSPSQVFMGAITFHDDPAYSGLVVANIGAVIMPWMVYFQQSAVVARQLTTMDDLAEERVHTFVGSVLTQLVMIGALVTLAAAHSGSKNLDSVTDIVLALEPVLGETTAKVLVSLGFVGGSICASFVVSLAAAWALAEAIGSESATSLDKPLNEAWPFYACFLGVMIIGVATLLGGVNIVRLNVFVEFMDGLLMPFAVGFLFLLASGDALPPHVRLVGVHKWVCGVLFTACALLSLGSALYSVAGG